MEETLFVSDLDFCPECGTVLPLPGAEDMVSCRKCDYKIDVRAFHGREIKSTTVFNEPVTHTLKEAATDSNRPMGPKVDRVCPQCGHDQMTYTTRQTRSADEGQTVFYTCIECRLQLCVRLPCPPVQWCPPKCCGS